MIETALYRHYDEAGGLLYVGIASNPVARTQQHSIHAPWYKDVDTIKIEWFASREEALEAELEAQHKERPKHNRRLSGVDAKRREQVRRAMPRKRYFPDPDEHGYPSISEKVMADAEAKYAEEQAEEARLRENPTE